MSRNSRAAVRLLAAGFLSLLVLGDVAAATPGEAGLPLVTSWRARDIMRGLPTEVGPQMFAVTEGPRGFIYVANNFGVLEFDGRSWQLVAMPGRSLALSLDTVGEGGGVPPGIYVGGAGRFGRLAPGATGALQFVSLSEGLSPEDAAFTDVWQTSAAPDGVYFRAPERLFRWREGEAIRSWNPAGSFGIGAVVHGRLYQRDTARGLLTLVGDELLPVPGGERFAAERLYVYLPFGEHEVLLGSRTQGLFRLDPRRTGADALQPWPTAADARLAECQLYHGAVLADGNFALGTLRCGLLIVDRAGRLVAEFDKSTGLADDFVLATFRDRAGDLWVAHNDGLSRLELPSPISRHDERTGLGGFVESFVRHRGRLYAATSLGLAVLESSPTGGPARFRPLPVPTTQFYRVLVVADHLVALSASGVFEILPDGPAEQLERLREGETWDAVVAREDPHRLFLATAQGLAALRWTPEGWLDEGLAPGLEAEIIAVAEGDDGALWLGTEYRSEGLLLARPRPFDAQQPRLVLDSLERFGADRGVPPGLVQAFSTSFGTVFGSHEGALHFDATARRFEPARELRELLGPGDLFRWQQAADGTSWVVSSRRVLRIRSEPHGLVRIAHGLERFPPAARILALYPEADDTLWVGLDDGAYRLEPARPSGATAATRLRRVLTLEGRELVGLGTPGAAALTVPLPPGAAGLRFEIASPGFRSVESQRFRTWLEGLEAGWSAWGPEARKDYTNLPPGRYVFHAQARAADGLEGAETRLSFEQLPPWYRTVWAYVGAGLGFVALLALGYRLALARLARRNRELESLVAARTRELEEASFTDALTGARNRRYFRHVLEPEIARESRRLRLGKPGSGLVIFLVDLDHFKAVNDRYGHDAGDTVLVAAAQRLTAQLRGSDLVFRWGGEEFLLVARELEPSRAAETAARLLAALGNEPIVLDPETRLTVTGSIGWVPFPWPGAPDALSLTDALTLADRALYYAKEAGRARAVGVVPTAVPPPEDWKSRGFDVAAGVWLEVVG